MICARSEVGLSRLPVTEEIAGSNPVERATDNSPLDRVFFYGKYSIFIAFMYNLCYDIANWTVKSKEFYNKIPDNVRERTPSVMVYNPNNPSGSKLEGVILTRRLLLGAGAFATVAALMGGCVEQQDSPQPTYSSSKEADPAPTSTESTPMARPTPEEIKNLKFAGLPELVSTIEGLDPKKDHNKTRAALIGFINENIKDDSAKIDTDEYGRVYTSKEDIPETMKKVGMNTVQGLSIISKLYGSSVQYDYPLQKKDAEKIMDAYVENFTVGSGRKSLNDLIPDIASYPMNQGNKLFKQLEVGAALTPIYEAEPKDENSSVIFRRNNLNTTEGETKDLLHSDGLNWGNGVFAYQGFFPKGTTKEIPGDTLTEVVVFARTTKENDPTLLNTPATEQQGNATLYETDDGMYITGVIGAIRDVKQDSKIPTLVKGQEVPASQVPQIENYFKSIK